MIMKEKTMLLFSILLLLMGWGW